MRLFLPLFGMLWLLIICFAVIQHRRESELKRELIYSRIDIISDRLISLYEEGGDIAAHFRFLDSYFAKPTNSLYEDVSISMFDNDTHLQIGSMGFDAGRPENIPIEDGTFSGRFLNESEGGSGNFRNNMDYYYNITTSPDGRMSVRIVLPIDDEVASQISGDVLGWVIIVLGGLAMSLVLYVTTSHVARNVRVLRRFAHQAANGQPIDDIVGFGDDDLGDIGRKIVDIYNERALAQRERDHEHNVAIKATEERANLKRQLTDNISHELKTPVGVVRGYVDTLVENPDMDNESRNHFLKKAQSHVERLCNLLNDLSTINRLEEASNKIPLEEINFSELLHSIVHDVEESRIAGDMTFKIDVPDDIHVMGNGALLAGAIMNLVKNAANYSHGTEMGVKMLTRNTRKITFIFWDNGTGVEQQHIPHLFDRFYRVDKGRSRKVGGTGLGLPIVRSSINSMGGSITVRNASTHGLEFVFALVNASDPRLHAEK